MHANESKKRKCQEDIKFHLKRPERFIMPSLEIIMKSRLSDICFAQNETTNYRVDVLQLKIFKIKSKTYFA